MQRLIDLVVGNEIPPQGIKSFRSGECQGYALQILQFLQQLGGIIPAADHETAVAGIGSGKQRPFIHKPVQRIRGFQKPLHLGFDFGEALIGGTDFHCEGKIPGFFRLRGAFPHGKGKRLGNSASFKGRNLFKFLLGHIPPHVQQFPDTLCRLLPCDKSGMQLLNGAAGGDANALRVIPDGVFLTLDYQPRAIGAVASLQESGIVRLVLHKVGADDLPAVPVVETHAQGFVDNLLGELQLREEGLLRFFRYRKTAVQKGNLFLHAGQRQFFNYA